ncbi:MAG: hypothetical protein N3B13_00680, partial [Deltaproteobacteria bacterium]|nr:hypothetical protein [Deltaproteobacteria bacterium]
KSRLHVRQNDRKISQDTENKTAEIREESEERNDEDFSAYSSAELKDKLSDCINTKDYRCIARAALNLAKTGKEEEKRKYRMVAIESLVELTDCASAMLQIMLLFKENPDIREIHRAHFLNARCYLKEKNFRDAKRILSMIENDAPELKGEIAKLREEIKKGEEDGKQTKSEGVQDRDSP